MHKWYIFLLFIYLMSVTCEKSISYTIMAEEQGKLVVQAIITDENRFQEIQLSRSFQSLNESPEPITNARVTVMSDLQQFNFVNNNLNPGTYKSEIPFAAVPQTNYRLIIELDGENYEANSTLSTVAPIPEIQFKKVADSFELGESIVPLFSNSQQALYQFDLDWSHIFDQGLNNASIFYYTFSTVHISEFVRPPRQDILFPSGTEVIVTKYGLTDDYAEYLRAVAIETEWNGSIFYGNPANQPSNISSGAIGIFATCAIRRDTLVAE